MVDQKLPRTRRIGSSARIRQVLAGGSRSAGSHVLVITAPNDLDRVRLCAIVGKKVSKRAVLRNRVKRLIREAFRRRRPQLPEGRDYVVIALARDVDWTLDAVETDLVRGTQRACRPRKKGKG